MDHTEQLWIIQKIRAAKAGFIRGADTRDADLLRRVMTEDIVIDFTEGARDPGTGFSIASPATAIPLVGREAAVSQMCNALSGMVSIHHVGEPEIEIIDRDHATAIWPVTDRLFLPPGGTLAEIGGYGHYHETYRREDDAWRIATLRLTRLRFFGVAATVSGG